MTVNRLAEARPLIDLDLGRDCQYGYRSPMLMPADSGPGFTQPGTPRPRRKKPEPLPKVAAPASSDTTTDWRHRAVCRDEDSELFFPVGTSGPALLQVEQAKAVCRRCPVSDECLQWALASGTDHGVWGGMSEEERRAIKRRGGLRILREVA